MRRFLILKRWPSGNLGQKNYRLQQDIILVEVKSIQYCGNLFNTTHSDYITGHSLSLSWPGASLIMIKGYKHLQDCAYIGDDSSEELDELMESYKQGLMNNTTLLDKINQLNKEDGKANDPGKSLQIQNF